MRTAQDWLDEYGESHRHPANKTIHWICVPLIMLSALGFFSTIPRPAFFGAVSPYLDWAVVVILAAFFYYLMLSLRLALGMLVISIAMLVVLRLLAALPWALWATCLVIFVGAWIGQFVGHRIEGKKPSFFKDLQFLLIGPMWLLSFLYRRMGVAY